MTRDTDADRSAAQDDEMVRATALVPKTIKKQAKQQVEHGGLTREIRACLAQVADGQMVSDDSVSSAPSEVAQLREQLADAREQLRDYKHKAAHYNIRVATQTNHVERLEARLSEAQARDERTDEGEQADE